MSNSAVLPAPLHLKIVKGRMVESAPAQAAISHFLAFAAPFVLGGSGGAATRASLVRLVEGLREELDDAAKVERVVEEEAEGGKKDGEGKKKKRRKSEKGTEEGSKRRKVVAETEL